MNQRLIHRSTSEELFYELTDIFFMCQLSVADNEIFFAGLWILRTFNDFNYKRTFYRLVGREEWGRIDRTSIMTDFEVEMRTRRASRRTGKSDQLTFIDLAATSDCQVRMIRVC